MHLERIFTYRLVRALRIAVPILVVVSIAIPAWNYFSRRQDTPAEQQTQQLPPDAAVLTKDVTYSQTDGGRVLFTVHAKSNLGFKDSRNMLQDVDVTVFGATEGEPTRRVHSRNCSVDQQSNDIHCTGDVQFQLSENTHGRSEELTYNSRARIVASSQETIIEQPGSTTAHADNFEYGLDSGLLKLAGNVKVLTADNASLEADSAMFHQKENWATVTGSVFMKSQTGWIRGAQGHANLEANTFRPKTIMVEGNVSAESQATPSSDAWKLSAARMDVALSAAGSPERLQARGNVDVEKISGSARQRLTGEEVDATMDAAGRADVLEARRNARMDFGADQSLRSTQIRSTAAGSVETTDASVLQIGDSVIEGREFTIQRGEIVAFSTPRRATLRSARQQTSADRTEARFDNRNNTLVELIQAGHFEFKDTQFQGTAQNAHFEDGGNIVTLGGGPVVNTAQMRLEAGEIRLNHKENSFSAFRNVKSVSKGAGEPALVIAGRAQGNAETIVYTENVQLWRGGNTNIKAQRLEISKSNRLEADGKVDSRFDSIRAVSDKLEYDDASSTAHYTGNVRAQKQDMILATRDMTVKLREKEKDVAEIVATGDVQITRGGQRGTSQQALYDARTDIITLTGKNSEVHDNERGTFQGDRLIMKTTGDDITVDGEHGGRTVTRHPVIKK